MKIIKDKYFNDYKSKLNFDIQTALQSIDRIKLTPESFTFYTSVAVMASSKIEGEQMEIDSYVKHKMQDIEYLPELTEKPNDLYKAYEYVQDNKLTEDNFLQSHKLLTEHLLPEKHRGSYRNNEMLVMEHKTGRIQFEAAKSTIVETEMKKLWSDVDDLLDKELSANEIFYYSAFIHLVFVCIHPFNDGNGRAARLLEKWFLAEKLGERAWYIKSEKFYYTHVNDYYRYLNRLGIFYDELDFSKADNFLLMLPNAISFEQ